MVPVHPSLSLPIPLAVGITPTAAHVLSLLFASSYVGSIYLSAHFPPLRRRKSSGAPSLPPISATDSDGTISPVRPASNAPSRSGSPAPGERDHPHTIKSRIRAVSVATVLSLFGVGYAVSTLADFRSWTSVVSRSVCAFGSADGRFDRRSDYWAFRLACLAHQTYQVRSYLISLHRHSFSARSMPHISIPPPTRHPS